MLIKKTQKSEYQTKKTCSRKVVIHTKSKAIKIHALMPGQSIIQV